MSSTSLTSKKLGLGLSGGGFRASFFHIGVLAQMAELGLLRHVEVISTVSGGSIIGALYYLHIKKLLESKPDDEISDHDYIALVDQIEKDFLKATENNIRMSTFANFAVNFKMIAQHYSRSDRIAELYNDWLYQTVLTNVHNPVEMRELKIYPPNAPADFHPNRDNAARKAKVPILVLNATSLNTGRNWAFTAKTMGEPPAPSSDPIDKKPIRLRRANAYDDMVITEKVDQQTFPLGHAVAASACVPGLFQPMAVSYLYRDRQQKDQELRVQLVDGGVHDNQGIDGLLRNGCGRFIISDAAGQMGTENTPSPSAVPVLLRVSSVLQDRIRTEGLLHLLDSHGNDNVAFMNLREGLGLREIAWVDADGQQAPDHISPATTERFGVDPQVQDQLSKMRTDLDAFTEVEAYSLMLSGYRMSKHDLLRISESYAAKAAETAPDWRFMRIQKWLEKPSADYLKQLQAAQSTFGKALILMPWLYMPLLLVLAAVLYWLGPQLKLWLSSAIPISVILITVLLWLINSMAPKLLKILPFLEALRPQAAMAKAFGMALLLTLGTVFVMFYLKVINPLFLAYGRVSRLK